jgi:DNA recombination-dependent growth factor C
MFRNLRFYRITNPWPKTEQKLSEVLSENAFSPCGAFSERSAGWEAPAIYDDAPLCRRLHGADLLQLRTQSRVLSVAALNGELHQATGVRVDGAFAQLQRFHFTETLESRFADLGVCIFLILMIH